MIVINHWGLEDGPDEPFEYRGTPRGVFHRHLARLVEDAVRDSRQPALMEEPWGPLYGVAHFDLMPHPQSSIDLQDVIRANERHALRSDGDVVHIGEYGAYAVGDDSSLIDDLLELLPEIPTGNDLHELDADGFRASFASRSPVRRVIDRLSSYGIDRPAAIALLARVRPRLVPVDDRLIGTTLGLRIDEDPLRYWWWALHHDPDLVAAVRRIQAATDSLAGRSLLRVAEAVVLRSAAPAVHVAGRC